MSNDTSDDKPTEYLPGGAMANAYVPRGRQSNRRITRRVAQPEPNSVEQRKISVPNPPAGAPSVVPEAAALAGEYQTEVIPPVKTPVSRRSAATSYIPAHAAGPQVSADSQTPPPASTVETTQLPPIDPAAATPQVDSYPQGIPPTFDPQSEEQKRREEQEYEEERADKRRLLKVVGIVSAIVALLAGAVIVVALMISSKQVLPPAQPETTTSEIVTTTPSEVKTTQSAPETSEPATTEPTETETPRQPNVTQSTPSAPPSTRETPTQSPSTGGADNPSSSPEPSVSANNP